MTYAIIAILVLFAIGAFLIVMDDIHGGGMSFIGVLICLVGALGCAIVAIAGFSWVGAQYKADIINREYGTSYTRQDVFYASDVIDTIREIARQRIEVNGDLMRGGKPEED